MKVKKKNLRSCSSYSCECNSTFPRRDETSRAFWAPSAKEKEKRPPCSPPSGPSVCPLHPVAMGPVRPSLLLQLELWVMLPLSLQSSSVSVSGGM